MDGLLSKQNLPYFNSVSFLDLFLLLGTQRTFQNQISRFYSCFCMLKVNGMWRHDVLHLSLLTCIIADVMQ